MARSGWIGGFGAALVALGLVGPAAAQGLDPRVAGPLMQMIQAAGMQCQSGNQQACVLVPQLQQAGNELTQAQFACQQGNQQACQMFQMGAQQVMMAYQQNFSGGMAPSPGYAPQQPGYSPQQQAWDHQQRMQQQQMQFQQQQQQYQQQQRQNDWNHQRFMDSIRR